MGKVWYAHICDALANRWFDQQAYIMQNQHAQPNNSSVKSVVT